MDPQTMRLPMVSPKGLLFDYAETLIEEVHVDLHAGNEWMLSRACYIPAGVTLHDVTERASQVST